MIMGTIYIIIASVLWGLFHSILASHAFKHLVRQLSGPVVFYKLYRFSYNLFSVASFLPLIIMAAVFPDSPLYSIPSPWVYLTTIIQGMAVFALIAGVMQTGLMEFSGLAQLSPAYSDMKPTGLVMDGLYKYVRHPLYSSGLVFIWFSAEMSVNRFVLWLVMTVYIIIGAFFEERKLLIDFGEEYSSYKARTPMLIPGWFHIQRSNGNEKTKK